MPCGFYALGHRHYIYTAKFNSVRTLSLALRPAAWPRHAHAMLPKRVAASRRPTGNRLFGLLGIVWRNTSWPRSKSFWETCYEYTDSVWALELV